MKNSINARVVHEPCLWMNYFIIMVDAEDNSFVDKLKEMYPDIEITSSVTKWYDRALIITLEQLRVMMDNEDLNIFCANIISQIKVQHIQYMKMLDKATKSKLAVDIVVTLNDNYVDTLFHNHLCIHCLNDVFTSRILSKYDEVRFSKILNLVCSDKFSLFKKETNEYHISFEMENHTTELMELLMSFGDTVETISVTGYKDKIEDKIEIYSIDDMVKYIQSFETTKGGVK